MPVILKSLMKYIPNKNSIFHYCWGVHTNASGASFPNFNPRPKVAFEVLACLCHPIPPAITMSLDSYRSEAALLLSRLGSNPSYDDIEAYKSVVANFLSAGGCPDDYLVKIAEQFFDYFVKGGANDRSNEGPFEDSPIDGSVRIDFDYLENFMIDTFIAVGVPEREAKISADVLIEADKRGIDSHGIGRLKPIYIDRIFKGILHPFKPITVIKETASTALLDGHMGLGLYIGPHCMELAIQKAKQYGVGFVAVKNSTHYGIAGYYASMAIDAGCVGFTGTNARPSIAPTFGVEPCLGTNPLCFGVPTDEDFPFLVDCATSISQRGQNTSTILINFSFCLFAGKIEKYERLGLPTPKGCVIDNNGMERTDTPQILVDMVKGTCALTPVGGVGEKLGGYKV